MSKIKKQFEINNPFLRKNLSLISIASSLLLVLLFGLLLIEPKINSQAAAYKTKMDLQKKLDANLATLENLRVINVAKERERLSSVELLIPSQNDLLSTLSLIESLANISQLSIATNRAGNIVQNGTLIQGYTVQTSLEGSYLQVKSFLELVFKSKRAIGINNTALTLQEDGSVLVSMEFYLPQAVGTVQIGTIENVITFLTSEEEKIVGELSKRSLAPTATSSATLGRTDPFAKP